MSRNPVRRRIWLIRVVLIAAGTLLPLMAGEIVLRFLPVAEPIHVAVLDASSPVLHYVPHQEVTWSSGGRFSIVNRVRINNAGFVNDQAYVADSRTPLLAVIGDSYIEALMVPFEDTVHARLQRMLGARGRVYSFAKSGAPLSEYLAWADHARATYHASAMMISVVSNDFEESLAPYRPAAGHYFVDTGAGTLELQLFGYRPSLVATMARHSALTRYVMWNLSLQGALRRLRQGATSEAYVGNVPASMSDQVVAQSKRATDAFFRELPARSGLPPSRILFTLDALRPEIYDQARLAGAERSFAGQMRQYFLEQAKTRGYEVIDLQTVFSQEFAVHHEHFEFQTDNHWNATGHRVVAEQVAGSRVFAGFDRQESR